MLSIEQIKQGLASHDAFTQCFPSLDVVFEALGVLDSPEYLELNQTLLYTAIQNPVHFERLFSSVEHLIAFTDHYPQFKALMFDKLVDRDQFHFFIPDFPALQRLSNAWPNHADHLKQMWDYFSSDINGQPIKHMLLNSLLNKDVVLVKILQKHLEKQVSSNRQVHADNEFLWPCDLKLVAERPDNADIESHHVYVFCDASKWTCVYRDFEGIVIDESFQIDKLSSKQTDAIKEGEIESIQDDYRCIIENATQYVTHNHLSCVLKSVLELVKAYKKIVTDAPEYQAALDSLESTLNELKMPRLFDLALRQAKKDFNEYPEDARDALNHLFPTLFQF